MLRNTLSRQPLCRLAIALALSAPVTHGHAESPEKLEMPPMTSNSIIHKIERATDRVELIANSSRILTFDYNFHRVMVNNQEVLDVSPISPNQVQIFAKKPGVTQVNLFFREGTDPEEKEQVRTLDVIVFGDAQELTMLLHSQFPNSSLQVVPTASSVIISGFVDDPDHVQRIVEIAESYHPKVINNLNVGGGQQVLLHVKVMEISRTKLRDFGVDFAWFDGDSYLVSGIGGLINASAVNAGTVNSPGGAHMAFGIINSGSQFFGLLNALRQDDMLKVLANPTLVTVSGRPAFFNAGGEFPILVPQSLGTVSVQFKKFGTQLDFVPIVMGNANIRLEVRPRVSEIDTSRSVVVNNISVPALRVREVDTGVEMQAGQTLALAGLIQVRQDERTRKIPILGELPYAGVLFRRVRVEENEVELLILVTPQLAESMDCEEVPPCLPGTSSDVPRDWDFYLRGKNEVPLYRPGIYDKGGPPGEEGEEGGMLPGPLDMQPRPAEEVPPGAPAEKQVRSSGKAVVSKTSTSSSAAKKKPTTGNTSSRGPSSSSSNSNGKKTTTKKTTTAPKAKISGQPGLIGPSGYDGE